MNDLFENYYEHLVVAKLKQALINAGHEQDGEYVSDIACIALNQLPPRYMRLPLDENFFITQAESQQMDLKVQKAVEEAISFVDRRHNRPQASAGNQLT